MATLLVIDMQERFLYAGIQQYDDCVKNVVKQINLAKKRNDHILILEYVDDPVKNVVSKFSQAHSPTVRPILNAIRNYNKIYYVSKTKNDGGLEVLEALNKKKIPRNNIRITGVYTDWCVKATVLTMRRLMRQCTINIIQNAICAYNGLIFNQSEAIEELTFYNNVQCIG